MSRIQGERMTPPRELTLQFLTEPADVNFGGKVHGGMVMKWIDQGGLRLRRRLVWRLCRHHLRGDPLPCVPSR